MNWSGSDRQGPSTGRANAPERSRAGVLLLQRREPDGLENVALTRPGLSRNEHVLGPLDEVEVTELNDQILVKRVGRTRASRMARVSTTCGTALPRGRSCAGTSPIKGAELALTSVLHTWTRDLRFHPHVHCVVSGGGLSLDGTHWIPTRHNFLLPVRVLGALFRGKFLARLSLLYERGALRLDGPAAPVADPARFARVRDKLYRTRWVVYSKAPFGGPDLPLPGRHPGPNHPSCRPLPSPSVLTPAMAAVSSPPDSPVRPPHPARRADPASSIQQLARVSCATVVIGNTLRQGYSILGRAPLLAPCTLESPLAGRGERTQRQPGQMGMPQTRPRSGSSLSVVQKSASQSLCRRHGLLG